MWCAAYVVPAPPRLMTRGTWSEETRGENNLLPLSDIAVTVLHMNHTLLCRLKLFFLRVIIPLKLMAPLECMHMPPINFPFLLAKFSKREQCLREYSE